MLLYLEISILIISKPFLIFGISFQGKTEFRCPLCEKKWPYDEVRKLAKLSDDETLIFEDKVGINAVKKLVDFRAVSSLCFCLIIVIIYIM